MPLLLNALYILLLVACSPLLAIRAIRQGKYREGWDAKLWGKVPRRLSDRPCIWFHAVSVGEVKLLRPIIDELARRRPNWEIQISTTTRTGLSVARQNYPDLVTFYAPLDFSWSVREALARVRPSIVALVELELWPNLINLARGSGAHVAVVNGRLSERSHAGYRWLRWALRGTMESLDLVAAQNPEYGERFADLGTPTDRIRVTGSVKYDDLEADRANPRTLAARRALGLSGSDVVFVAGSTMEGEEAAALRAFQAARAESPWLKLILVPRHPERFESVAAALHRAGVSFVRKSALGLGKPGFANAAPPVILVDTMGELSAIWGLADIAFVGGSLFPGRGGQNMMEPAAYGAAVIFGPHTHNFKDAVEGLLACGGAVRVKSPEELESHLLEALREPELAFGRGANGRRFVLAQQGAATRTAAELDRLLTGAPVLRVLAA